MRELKFRVWHPMFGMHDPWTLKERTEFTSKPGERTIEVHWDEGVIFMQFTGLKDKNGKEIYESDIVRILYTDWPSQPPKEDGTYEFSLEYYKKSISNIGTVVWDSDNASFSVMLYSKKYGDYQNSRIIPGDHGEIEVIGDFYNNPELL